MSSLAVRWLHTQTLLCIFLQLIKCWNLSSLTKKCITPSSSSKNQDMHMLKWKSNRRVLSVETMPEPHPRAGVPSGYPFSMRRIQSKVKPIRTAIKKTHPALRLGDLLLMGSWTTQLSPWISSVRDEVNSWPIGWTVGPGMVFFSCCCGEGRKEKLWSYPNES